MTNIKERDLSKLTAKEVHIIQRNARAYIIRQDGMGTGSFIMASLMLQHAEEVGVKMSPIRKLIMRMMRMTVQILKMIQGEKNDRDKNVRERTKNRESQDRDSQS